MAGSLSSRKVTEKHGGNMHGKAGSGGESGQDSAANQFLVQIRAFNSGKIEQ